VFGCGDRQECFLEHRAVQGGDGEPAVALAVSLVDQREPGGVLGVFFFAFELEALVFLADLGGDHVQDPPAQDA